MPAKLKRRKFLALCGASLLNTACGHVRFDGGLWNPCPATGLPETLARHELVAAAWEDLDAHQVWDSHTHLVGTGDGDSGVWVNPAMRSWWHPIQHLQWNFYLNATCLEESASKDKAFVDNTVNLCNEFPAGFKCMLLAFDYKYDAQGRRETNGSGFHIPNAYAAQVAQRYPQRLEWIASIHPYREDCVSALDSAVAQGARAVKWLPPAMGIDPASALCEPFYQALIRHDLPLLCHAGEELAVAFGENTDLGNPLLLRRPLDMGVKVIVAHCASLGVSSDLDQGGSAKKLPSIELFSRLMADPSYENNLFGDIAALTQVSRVGSALRTVIQRSDWHPRLINGSDYPLPGVFPVISMKQLTEQAYITGAQAQVLSAIRDYNPLLFDFVLKRSLRYEGNKFSDIVFESRRLFRNQDHRVRM